VTKPQLCSHKVKCLYQHRAPALFALKTTLSSPALVHGDVDEYTSPFFGVLFHGYIPCTWLHECMRISLQPGLVCDWGLVYNAHITHNADCCPAQGPSRATQSSAGRGEPCRFRRVEQSVTRRSITHVGVHSPPVHPVTKNFREQNHILGKWCNGL
jgi:hypothetical protein